MTGGGFGGCTITLVRTGDAQRVGEALAGRYRAAYGRTPWVRVCDAADGAGRVG
jgi:galactokinase